MSDAENPFALLRQSADGQIVDAIEALVALRGIEREVVVYAIP